MVKDAVKEPHILPLDDRKPALNDKGFKLIPDFSDFIDNFIKKILNISFNDGEDKNVKDVPLKDIMKDEYIGDLFINNILIEIFRDDNLCKNRIILEIRNYQN